MSHCRSIDGRKLNFYITGEIYASCLEKCYKTLEKNVLFNTGKTWNDYLGMPVSEFRHLSVKRALALAEYKFIENEKEFSNSIICGAAYSDACCYLDYTFGLIYFINQTVCLVLCNVLCNVFIIFIKCIFWHFL